MAKESVGMEGVCNDQAIDDVTPFRDPSSAAGVVETNVDWTNPTAPAGAATGESDDRG